MKTKTALKLVLGVLGAMLLQVRACGDDQKAVVEAINAATDRLTTGFNNSNTQMGKLFDKIFVANFKDDGSVAGPSILNDYTTQFYLKFAKGYTPILDLSVMKAKSQDNTTAVGKLLSRETGYNMSRSLESRNSDSAALFDANFDVVQTDAGKESGTLPYGALDDKAPAADSAPNVTNLIGPDGYDENMKSKAKRFISAVLQSAPSARYFSIPKIGTSGNSVTMALPYKDEKQKPVQVEISTKTSDPSKCKDNSSDSEYKCMKAYLDGNSLFQEYKKKVLANSTARTLYTETMYNTDSHRLVNRHNQPLIAFQKSS